MSAWSTKVPTAADVLERKKREGQDPAWWWRPPEGDYRGREWEVIVLAAPDGDVWVFTPRDGYMSLTGLEGGYWVPCEAPLGPAGPGGDHVEEQEPRGHEVAGEAVLGEGARQEGQAGGEGGPQVTEGAAEDPARGLEPLELGRPTMFDHSFGGWRA